VQSISQTQIQQTLHLIADSLSFNAVAIDTMLFTKVHYAYESGRICDTGCPELPIISYNFIIPQNKVASQITLSNKVTFPYTINYPIYPVQEPEVTCIDCATPDFCFPNRQVYESTAAFPTSNMVSVQHNFFDGNHILTIGICPFEYYPTTGQINMLTSFDLNIDLVPDTVQRCIVHAKRLHQSQEVYNRMLWGLVENKNQIDTFQNNPIFVDDIGDTPSGLPAYEYVVVTPSAYTSAFSDFITWKKQKGIDIGIVTIEEVLSHYSGDEIHDSANNVISVINDNAGKLRQYLREAYSQGMVYALLAGDLPSFPIRYGWAFNNVPDTDYYNVIPTDLYFADFDGNWNVDGDAYYGEFGYGMQADDAPDFFADVFVGRLMCSSIQDISNWVAKMLIYEKNPGQGNPSYLTRSFMTESDQAQEKTIAENVASHLSMYEHLILKELPNYNSVNPVFPKGSDIIRLLKTDRYGLVSWFNHGGTGNGESGISTMTSGKNHYPQWKLQAQEDHPYSQAEQDTVNGLDNLTNNNEPFVVYAISCNVTPFDKTSSFNNSGARNCGESVTVNNLAGGIAFLGNCRYGYFNESTDLFNRFADLVSECLEEQDYPHFGALENGSKSLCAFSWKHKYLCYSHNLIGDPECSLWINNPERLSVSVLPQSAVLNNSNCFHVKINNLNCGRNAVVTLYKGGELYQRIEVIGNQQNMAVASFNSVVPTTLGDIVITVTSYGYLPYQKNVTVNNNCEMVINNTEVWHDDDIIGCDIIINSNSSLYIMSELCMAPNTKIIVKPGGRLYLDGGKLTSSCSNEMWQGIEVWGNSNSNQKETDGQYEQGYIELKNGAIIENAVCAVELWHPGYWSTTGGIIHATDATFRNCTKAVHALFYRNVYPNGIEHNYNSFCTRCTFVVDENYIGNENQVFYKHVDLSHVRGLRFYSCDFSVAEMVENVSYWSCGIAASEAGFTVQGICTNNNVLPCPSYDTCTFNGFFMAIKAVSSGYKSAPTITVIYSSFTNNDYGVYMRGLNYSSILFCDFNVKRHGYWPCGAGILSENMNGICFEDNEFKKTNTFNGNGYGIIVNNSMGQNMIYRNRFERLYCGNLAQGKNIYLNTSNNYLGLEYKCNTNQQNLIDFYVLKDGTPSGIQTSQGSDIAAARNTFSEDGYHFYNGGDYKINYYYYDVAEYDDEKPLYYNEDKFIINPIMLTDGCPQLNNLSGNENGFSMVLTPTIKQQLEQEYYEAHYMYNSLKSVYEQRIDGGSTSNMISEIKNAHPEDMWQLRSSLLGSSPYLSEEVLFATSDRDDVISEPVLFEILLSNPDELKKDSLLNHLKSKTNPMPQYMIDILEQVANGTSAKTVLQNSLAAHRNTYNRAACDIVRSIINDTVLDKGELRVWLGNLESINADRDIIATYVDEGDFNNAFTLANMLPSLYRLTGENLVEHEDYLEFLELYEDLYNSGRNLMQLDSTEMAFVKHVADYGLGYPRIIAQNVLEDINGNDYFKNSLGCPMLTLRGEETNKGKYDIPVEDLKKAIGMSVVVKPNPASTWVSIDYNLPANTTTATLSVANALGVTVFSEKLNGQQGQKILDLRSLANGIYVYSIRCGEYVLTGKLVVTK
jgi:hypothetical protein